MFDGGGTSDVSHCTTIAVRKAPWISQWETRFTSRNAKFQVIHKEKTVCKPLVGLHNLVARRPQATSKLSDG
jgi:hypothetical protein